MMLTLTALHLAWIPQKNKCARIVSAIFAALLLSSLPSCAMLDSDSVEVNAEDTQPTQSAEEQLAVLQEQMKSMKADWEQQKPALGRLISSEEDLQFLIKTLSEMSELDDAPSRAAYLGKVEKTPQQEDALQSLQSVVDSQDQLLGLLDDLSDLVGQVNQNNSNQSTTSMQPSSGAPAYTDSTEQPGAAAEAEMVAADVPASGNGKPSDASFSSASAENCACDQGGSEVLTSQSEGVKSRNADWFGLTEPFIEATPAGSSATVSQLDSADVNSGQPIPGLQVKTFKRRSLPSELAAAGAPIQHYAMAPQFHMSRKSLSDYVSQLAFKLAGNQQLSGNKVGVASFVFFDEQLEQTSSVGNQLAEQLSTVLPEYGALVVEYKLTREITVGPTGDLSLSRNTRKLRDSQGMDYVLTGTMVPTRRGLQINSRVVSTRDNVVIASATTLIPAMVLGQL